MNWHLLGCIGSPKPEPLHLLERRSFFMTCCLGHCAKQMLHFSENQVLLFIQTWSTISLLQPGSMRLLFGGLQIIFSDLQTIQVNPIKHLPLRSLPRHLPQLSHAPKAAVEALGDLCCCAARAARKRRQWEPNGSHLSRENRPKLDEACFGSGPREEKTPKVAFRPRKEDVESTKSVKN